MSEVKKVNFVPPTRKRLKKSTLSLQSFSSVLHECWSDLVVAYNVTFFSFIASLASCYESSHLPILLGSLFVVSR